MKTLAWHGKGDIRCDDVADPRIEHPRDAIIKVTACAICGSDLRIYGGIILSKQSGDILGHESMGEVVEVGSQKKALKVGDRVVVPFTIACGERFFCRNGFYSGCERLSAMSRCFSYPTFSRPVTWQPISATSKAAKRSRCGDDKTFPPARFPITNGLASENRPPAPSG